MFILWIFRINVKKLERGKKVLQGKIENIREIYMKKIVFLKYFIDLKLNNKIIEVLVFKIG